MASIAVLNFRSVCIALRPLKSPSFDPTRINMTIPPWNKLKYHYMTVLHFFAASDMSKCFNLKMNNPILLLLTNSVPSVP